MVDYLRAGYEVSTRQACRVVQLARRTYYYQSTADPQTALRIRLRDLAESRFSYGYRRLHVLLRREGWAINPNRVYRLYCEEGLGLRIGKPVENVFIESFNASFRKECLNSHWFQTLDEATLTIEQWRKEYNRNRPHSSLGNLTPREYAEKHHQPEASETEILTLEAVQ